MTGHRGQISLKSGQVLLYGHLLYGSERLAGVPKEGKHRNVVSGGHLTWSVMTFSEEKSDLGEMTAKQLSVFRGTASLEE